MSKYGIIRRIIKIATKIYVRPKYEGVENIPDSGAFIFAGNHIHLCDPATIMSVTKRQVHFLAKASLFEFPKSLIFNNMGLIKVERNGRDVSPYRNAVNCLKNGGIIGIYPEGTRERGRGLLPFKSGAVKMAYDADCVIIPFATIGEYKPFRKGIIVRFGEPYKPSEDLKKSNGELKEIVRELLEK